MIFCNEVRGLQLLKSNGAQILWKIHFCPNLGRKAPNIGYFAFFENSCRFSPKNNGKRFF